MFIDEILPVDHRLSPVPAARLVRQQERERAERNAQGLRSWYMSTFGNEAGAVLAQEHITSIKERP